MLIKGIFQVQDLTSNGNSIHIWQGGVGCFLNHDVTMFRPHGVDDCQPSLMDGDIVHRHNPTVKLILKLLLQHFIYLFGIV